MKSIFLLPCGVITTDCDRPLVLRSSLILRLLLNEVFGGGCLAVIEADLPVSDVVLFSSAAVPIDAFLAGRVPVGNIVLLALSAAVNNLVELPPPKLPFGVGTLFP